MKYGKKIKLKQNDLSKAQVNVVISLAKSLDGICRRGISYAQERRSRYIKYVINGYALIIVIAVL